MKPKQKTKNEERNRGAVRYQAWEAPVDALAIREIYPAEEFAGFERFGESPEWEPGQAEQAQGLKQEPKM